MLELRVKAPHVKIAVLHPGGIKTNIANHTLDPKNTPGSAANSFITNAFNEVADLTADDAADWIIGGVKANKYRILVGYDAILFDGTSLLYICLYGVLGNRFS
jgi:hypothetical protein